MGYQVLARKYRPTRFADLIGQPHVVKAMGNALRTGRLAQAFLFTGSRGTGKTSSARILAAALNCAEPDDFEPCGKCDSCQAISRSEDLDVIEMDAASNSRVDDIRERLESVGTRPARGKYRIFIIDEVHMLSTSAFNALLKTIEEPPAHVKFILATTNPEKIPETVISRCQRYDFRRVTNSDTVARMLDICQKEEMTPQDGVLPLLADLAEGGMRDALGRLDQLVAFNGTSPSVEDALKVFGLVSREKLLHLFDQLAEGNAAEGVMFTEEVFNQGKDVAEILASLISITRIMLFIVASGGDDRLIDVAKDELPALQKTANKFGLQGLVYMAELLNDCRSRVRRAAFPRVIVETTFIKMAMVPKLESLDTLIARLDEAADAPIDTAHNVTNMRPASSKDDEKPVNNDKEQQPSSSTKQAVDNVKRVFKAR
ncbi:MAG: DNA polymerase III subunit gamma/tau [Planctomycetota bacterium]